MMMRNVLPIFSAFMCVLAFSSCKNENASPIRNVRFDPNLLNKMQSSDACTNYSYFYNSEPRNLGSVYTEQILVAFSDGLSDKAREQVISKYGFVKQESSQTSSNSAVLHTLVLQGGLSCRQVEQAMKVLAADNQVKYVAPYFLTGSAATGTELLGLSNEAIVRVEPGQEKFLSTYADAYKAKVLMPLGNDTYVVAVDKKSRGNALAFANFLQAQKGIVHAEPDFIVSLTNASL